MAPAQIDILTMITVSRGCKSEMVSNRRTPVWQAGFYR